MWPFDVIGVTMHPHDLNRVLEYFEICSDQHVVLYVAPFLAEPAAWTVAVIIYPAPASLSKHEHWFLAPPMVQRQVLVVAAPRGRWHLVPVPKPPIIASIAQNLLLAVCQQDAWRRCDSSRFVTIHEHVPATGSCQRCRFEIQTHETTWEVGLFEDSDGPWYCLLF